MKFKNTLFVLLAGSAFAGGIHSAVAQGTSSPTVTTGNATTAVAPAQGPAMPATPTNLTAGTPVVSGGDGAQTTVYLSKDYTKLLEANHLFDSDKFTAVFVGFNGDFFIFKQKGSGEQIYIPKSAILYMRGPGVPTLQSR